MLDEFSFMYYDFCLFGHSWKMRMCFSNAKSFHRFTDFSAYLVPGIGTPASCAALMVLQMRFRVNTFFKDFTPPPNLLTFN